MGTITVSNLGKAYKQYPNRWARLLEWFDPRNKANHTLKWVLQDINFTVQPGEAVGIIGMNGAGKSTLLKMITGTTQPTTGGVQITGRVAALLELGMGFHPDFTGRQNVLMAGQLQGLAVEEITALMPEIEAFADIGDYIDQPVRVYSSGMQVRLAFAVSTAVRPDVLIVDEALSVGDAAFQRKCFRRIEDFRSAGTTLLFVSHDINTVKKLCTRALFIKKDDPPVFGGAKQICDEYEKSISSLNYKHLVKADTEAEKRQAGITSQYDQSVTLSCEMIYGNGKADIEAAWLEDLEGNHINVVESGTPFCWSYRVKFNEDVSDPIFGMMLKTKEGIVIYGVNSKELGVNFDFIEAGNSINVTFKFDNPIAPGTYYLNCGVSSGGVKDGGFICRCVDSRILRVAPGCKSTVVSGLIDLGANLAVRVIS